MSLRITTPGETVATPWDCVIAEQKRWTERVCRYLDDWTPEPADMPAQRAAAFATYRQALTAYARQHGDTLRQTFRLALSLDIHRRLVHIHGHDSEEIPWPLYTECKRDPSLASTTWAGAPLATSLDRCLVGFAADSARADLDPDVMTSAGTSDLAALVELAEHRRRLVELLESDEDP